MVALVVGVWPLMSACQQQSKRVEHEQAARVEHVDGSDVARVTLTQKAIERIGLETGTVEERTMSPAVRIVPYSALIYDAHGDTWVYTSSAPRSFVRQKVTVDRIAGNDVILADGPTVGTVIATVGVAELYGTEFEVGH